MLRMRLFKATLWLACLLLTSGAGEDPASHYGPVPNGVRKITFKQMLKTGLKARRPEEFRYIDEIVRLVEVGYIRKHMVLGTFFYAREQSDYMPLPYFQQALVDRAAKEGKKVPGLQPGTGARGHVNNG